MAEMTPYRRDLLSLFDHGLDLSPINGRSVLVAGATGLIGSCIVDLLMAYPRRNYEVYALGRDEQRMGRKFGNYITDPKFMVMQKDISEPFGAGPHIDYIIDAASEASPNAFKSSPVEVMKANILGVCNLMDFAVRHGTRRMVFLSSGEVYGEGDGKPFTERDSGYVDCATARACYPSSKRAAETMCIAYAEEYKQDVVIARLCHTYGPGFTEKDNRVYAQFVRNVLNGEDIVMKSKGGQYRSWLYVVDAASAILTLMMRGENKNAYNVAAPHANVTIRQLAEAIAGLARRKVVLDIPDGQLMGNSTPITKATFDTTKLQGLGWKPLFGLEEGLLHTLQSAGRG